MPPTDVSAPKDQSVSIIIPAHNEAGYIGACLDALLNSTQVEARVQVLVVANGCSDNTTLVARAFLERAKLRGWIFDVITLDEGNKLGALNAGDERAAGDIRVYLDADVVVDPELLGKLVASLNTDAPRYASGKPIVAPAISAVTRRYASFWQKLPFVAEGVPGFGVFAVNGAGRRRWAEFPQIISDDTFVRLHFAPSERRKVDAGYVWPMVEGFGKLVKVRQRQDCGVEEIEAKYPHLLKNARTAGWTGKKLVRQVMSDPLGFAVYAAVKTAVKLSPEPQEAWARGR